jgi:multidrug transporter EmrE-like cation transporter
MNTYTTAVISILLSVAAQFALKAGMSSEGVRQSLALPFSRNTLASVATNRHVLAGFFLYGLGALVWLAVLAKWDVSKAYPLVGLGFVLTAAIGFLTGEQLSSSRLGGITLICLGVVLVGRS